ncbi:MAG: hypothetical protein ABWY94_10325 [Pseudoxanthomonas sp.]
MASRRFLLAFLLFLVSRDVFCSESPDRIVERFYDWAIHTVPGDPSGFKQGLDPARQLLGQELFLALEAQRAYEQTCVRLVPKGDMKPHMLDQSPFFDAPDAVQFLESTRAVIKGDTARVFARLSYDDAYPAMDTVILRRKDDRWAIVNIEWQAGRSLTKRLLKFSSYRCKPHRG